MDAVAGAERIEDSDSFWVSAGEDFDGDNRRPCEQSARGFAGVLDSRECLRASEDERKVTGGIERGGWQDGRGARVGAARVFDDRHEVDLLGQGLKHVAETAPRPARSRAPGKQRSAR